jgi:hypothetical protein
MKTLLILSTILILSLVGCESKTEREIGATETVETTTVTTPTVDTEAAEDMTRDAAQETGTALESAGRELQEEARTDTK